MKIWDGNSVIVVAENLWDGASEFSFSPDGQTLRYLACQYDIKSASETCGDGDSVVYSADGTKALAREGQICLFPMGTFGDCQDLPGEYVTLLGWRP